MCGAIGLPNAGYVLLACKAESIAFWISVLSGSISCIIMLAISAKIIFVYSAVWSEEIIVETRRILDLEKSSGVHRAGYNWDHGDRQNGDDRREEIKMDTGFRDKKIGKYIHLNVDLLYKNPDACQKYASGAAESLAREIRDMFRQYDERYI